MASVGKRRQYYTPAEVAVHNSREDCWVSLFNRVLDLSPLLEKDYGELAAPIVSNAGEDVSYWFDSLTQDLKTYIDPESNLEMPYVPGGRFVHVPPPEPVTNWCTDFGQPWWKDERFVIGRLSKKTRKIRVVNTLTTQDDLLTVCAEETLLEIQDRYTDYNKHAGSYTWKALDEGEFRPLDMELTLADNGVADLTEEFASLSIDPDEYIPVIHVYFNDDLTSA